jgi:NTE family protein
MDHHYENIVLSGGGVKVIASIGALEVIQELGILKNIKGFAGSSAGAIIAGALSIGYTVDEIKDIMMDKNFNDFKDYYHLTPLALFYHYGCCAGDAFMNWFGDMVKKKTGNAQTTFKDVYEQYGKYLIITGCCVNKRETHYYSHISNPTMPIINAVRISMSIPGLFSPVKWNDDFLVDGGLLENYCIYIFDKESPNSKLMKITAESPPHIPTDKTLGLKLLCSDEQPDGKIYHGNAPIHNFFDYILSIVNTMLTQIERSYIHTNYWNRTIPIQTGDIPITDFNLTKEEKLKLIALGVESATKFFTPIKSDDLPPIEKLHI